MIDGLFIHHLVNDLKEIKNFKITKVRQINNYEFLFTLYNNKSKNLIISAHPNFARMNLTDKNYEFNEQDNIISFFRKNIESSIIKDITQHNNDRIITITLDSLSSSFDYIKREIILELFGRNSNLIILEEGKIIFALKYTSIMDNNHPILYKGIYNYPSSNKLNPYINFNYNNYDYNNIFEIINDYDGISNLFIKELEYRKDLHNFNILIKEYKPCIKNKEFYFLDLKHLNSNNVKYFDNLSLLLDYYFYDKEINLNKNLKNKKLDIFLKNLINRTNKKINKLKNDLKNNSNYEIYKLYGDLIINNLYNINKYSNPLIIKNYDDKEYEIQINNNISLIDNANNYYKKYKKLKTSLPIIKENIDNTIDDLKYYQNLLFRLDNNEDIENELEYLGYIKEKKRKDLNKPLITTYIDNLGIEILVGKNKTQNEYLTHKIANKNDYFMHVKNQSGSHVIIKTNNPQEETIRTAAMICAYYSKDKYSQSIPIDYCMVRYVKKIPKHSGSNVIYTNYKTIYIDIDKEKISKLKKKVSF